MGITGRYDFTGIQKAMRAAISALIAGTAWGAWLLASPFMPAVNAVEDWATNWLANHGLIILNIGANIVDGKIDQAALDKALDAGIRRVMQGRDKISPAEGKAIDDEVRQAFDKDADVGAVDTSRDVTDSVPKLPAPPV